jgi:prophage regulatory protein
MKVRNDNAGSFVGDFFPSTGFVRVSQILQVIPIGESTWWAGVASGRFPKSVKLGPRTTVWRAQDIRELLERLSEEGVEK